MFGKSKSSIFGLYPVVAWMRQSFMQLIVVALGLLLESELSPIAKLVALIMRSKFSDLHSGHLSSTSSSLFIISISK
jgi:hypothetical protein